MVKKMNDFIVTVNDEKRIVKVSDNNHVIIDGKKVKVELSKVNKHLYLLKYGNKVFEVTTTKLSNEKYSFLVTGNYFETTVRTSLREKAVEYLKLKQKLSHHDILKAPMPGLLLKIKKKEGDSVEMGESIAILEAMKMENDIISPATGIIKEICKKEGSSVEKDEIILKIE
jgi:biotin carboxyl carrier protein